MRTACTCNDTCVNNKIVRDLGELEMHAMSVSKTALANYTFMYVYLKLHGGSVALNVVPVGKLIHTNSSLG